MKNFIKIFLLLTALSIQTVFAQTAEPEMADAMRANGKIYVVVGIIVIILIGVLIYLFTIDRKVTRLENKLNTRK